MKIHFAETRFAIPMNFLAKYTKKLEQAYADAAELLPFGSAHLNFFVQPRPTNLIPETGDSGHTHNSELIELAFDPTREEAGLQTILNNVRPTVFHEMNHAARWHSKVHDETFLGWCVFEGLATAFERDYSGVNPLWSEYPDDVRDWVTEIIEAGDIIDFASYMYRHDDGRRWIGYKVGTYIVDQAKERSGKSIPELTQLDYHEILSLVGIIS